MADLTNYTEAWKMNAVAGAAEPGVKSVYNWSSTGAAGGLGSSNNGHIEDPAGNNKSRGLSEGIGGVSNDRYMHSGTTVQGDIWDIRGATSCTFVGWFFVPSGQAEEPMWFTLHEATTAPFQALWSWCNHPTFGATPSPMCGMLDGVNAFNSLFLQANDALPTLLDVWQFQAFGWNSATNVLFHFWGRAIGEHYYAETPGFAGGFGYNAINANAAMGRFIAAPPGDGQDSQMYSDQNVWWNGRALTENDLLYMWNNHAGRTFSDLVGGSHTIDNIVLESADYRNQDFTMSVMHRAEDASAHPYSRPTLMTQDYTSDTFSPGSRDWSARYIRNYYTIPPENFWQWYRVHGQADSAAPYIKEDAIRLFFRLYKENQEHHIHGPTVTATAKDTANLVPMSYIAKDIPKVADVVQWDDIVQMENFVIETKWVPPCPHMSWKVTTNMFEVYGNATNYIRVSCLGASTPEREYNFEDIYAPHEPTWRLEKVSGGVSEFTEDFVLYHSYGGTGSAGEWMLEDTIKFQLIHFAGEICQLRIFKGEIEGYVSFPAPVAFGGGLSGDFIVRGPGLWSAPLVRNTLNFTREATAPGRVFPSGRSGFARRLQGPGRNPILTGERDPNTGIINSDKSNPYLVPEDFNREDNANLGSRWFNDESTGNGWSIVSNKAECEELGWERWDNTPIHRDYIIDALVTLQEDNAYVGVFGRYERSRDNRTAYVARVHQTGAAAATLEIVRFWEGAAVVLSSDAFDTYTTGTSYGLKMTFAGTTLTARCDGPAEAVYTGSTGVTAFTGSSISDAPLTAGRLIIEFTIAGVVYQETDDGAGAFNNVSGFLTSGTVDYTTGALTLGFDTAPDNGTDIDTIQTEATTTTTDSFLPKPGRLGIYGATDAAGEKVQIDDYTVTRNHTVGIS